MTNQYIHIKGARVNNLKNIELKIPRNKLIVITDVRLASFTKNTTEVIKNSPKNIGKNVRLSCVCKYLFNLKYNP